MRQFPTPPLYPPYSFHFFLLLLLPWWLLRVYVLPLSLNLLLLSGTCLLPLLGSFLLTHSDCPQRSGLCTPFWSCWLASLLFSCTTAPQPPLTWLGVRAACVLSLCLNFRPRLSDMVLSGVPYGRFSPLSIHSLVRTSTVRPQTPTPRHSPISPHTLFTLLTSSPVGFSLPSFYT